MSGRWLRHPLLHFALLGAGLFLVRSLLSGPQSAPEQLHLRAPDVRRLTLEAHRELGREPRSPELEARVQAWIDDELLFREALAWGWQRSDPVVQRRLLQNMRFLGEDASDAELLERAYALGMDRSDVIVRRRLVERMKLVLGGRGRAQEPADAELERYLALRAERFRRPPRVRLSHVFLSRDRRGAALERDAETLRLRLAAAGAGPEAAALHGDPFLLGTELPLWSEQMLAGRLGAAFARRALSLEPGGWQGPVLSSYGAHLVWVHEHELARLPPLVEIAREVRAAWRAEREREALRQGIASLRQGVDVVVDEPPSDA